MTDGSTASQDGYHGGFQLLPGAQLRNRTVVVKALKQAAAMRAKVSPEPRESATGGTRSHFQGSPQQLLRIRNALNRSGRGQVQRHDAVWATRGSPDGVLIHEQPGFRHSDRNDRQDGHVLPNACNAVEGFVATILRMLPLGVSMHDDKIERIVKRKDGRKPACHIPGGRWIQASQIGGHNVHFEPMPLGDARHVATQRLVGWTVGQEKRAGRHASIKEI